MTTSSTRTSRPAAPPVSTTASSDVARVSEVARGIALSKTPEEANFFRTRIAALQKLIPKRRETFADAFDAATAYLKASIKAGELWAGVENKRPRGEKGHRSNVENSTLLSATDVGFADRKDAQIIRS